VHSLAVYVAAMYCSIIIPAAHSYIFVRKPGSAFYTIISICTRCEACIKGQQYTSATQVKPDDSTAAWLKKIICIAVAVSQHQLNVKQPLTSTALKSWIYMIGDYLIHVHPDQ
jgi:hypothetical protein